MKVAKKKKVEKKRYNKFLMSNALPYKEMIKIIAKKHVTKDSKPINF